MSDSEEDNNIAFAKNQHGTAEQSIEAGTEYGVDGKALDEYASAGNTNRNTISGCRKCGYPGHLSYECRNGIKIGAGRNQNFVLDISSTSSEDEDVRLLKELKASLKAAKDKKKMKKAKKKAKKAAREKRREDRKQRERSHSRSRSRSRSRDRRYRR
ncbi:unnamed protein product [Oikopleura dioica]|uniref:Protein SREK1IP1 n=1 Tax=Oikopleura dioica TaxID=34765 RepID=E4Y530_OIKDI|nr:unnamed protein product [Oikopleura dioica]CBY42175.1 unnamed protein product [Oikopleura dioica]